jgi:ABC-type multidrug transport system permease subunit
MLNIAFKELRLFFKDKKALLLTFITPLGLITLLVFAFGGNSNESKFEPITLQICDLDETTESKNFIRELEKVEQLEIEKKSEKESLENVKKGKRLAVLIIEKDFSKKIDEGESALIIHYDAAREPEFGILQSVLMGEVMQGIGKKGIKAKVMKKMEEKFGKMDSATMDFVDKGMTDMFSGEGNSPSEEMVKIEKVQAKKEVSPALIHAVAGTAVMTLLFAVAGMGASLLDEKEKGTLKRLLLTPISPMMIFFGKMTSGIIISIMQLSIMFLFANIAFGLDIFSVLPGLLTMIMATAFTCSCFGLFIASISSTRKQVEGMSTAIVLIMSAIGGSMIPSFVMPEFMQNMSVFTVNYWSIQGMYDIFWRDLPMNEWMTNVFVLFGIGMFFIVISVPMYKRNILKV